MFEIQKLPEDGVKFAPAKIEFAGYEQYKKMAEDIADYIRGIELTEDNVKDVKKVLADARKVTDGLNRERINIKNTINSDYKVFEGKVKELIGIIDEADGALRSKVKEIEEAEREAKKEEIIDLWYKRVTHYRINSYFTKAYEIWMTPQHLNKSMSMKAVEADMVEWLEETERAFETLDGMDDEYLVEYINCWDLSTAIKAVNERNKRREIISKDEEAEAVAHFLIRGDKDIKLAKMILKENGINFEVI